MAGRRDLRSLCIFSIDPTTARDIDDALHVTVGVNIRSCTRCAESTDLVVLFTVRVRVYEWWQNLGGGLYEVGVHIADVSHFVRPGSNIDGVARRRATSVYLVHVRACTAVFSTAATRAGCCNHCPNSCHRVCASTALQRVIPMLPRILCENLCSLNRGVDRLAFSVIWVVDAEVRRCLMHDIGVGRCCVHTVTDVGVGRCCMHAYRDSVCKLHATLCVAVCTCVRVRHALRGCLPQ